MIHLLLLLFSLLVWIFICHTEGVAKARSRYLLNSPELSVVKNGIRWLREHNLNTLRYIRIGLVYLLVILIKVIYLYFKPFAYVGGELVIMLIAVFTVPLFMFPFFHDRAYYKEYNRLSKVDYQEFWYSQQKIPASIKQIGKIERIGMLFAGLIMLLGELLIQFAV